MTLTVRETFTSSYDPETLRSVSEARDVHALLREDVYPDVPKNKRGCFWSRDVLGALNILRKGTHLLQRQMGLRYHVTLTTVPSFNCHAV